MELLRRRTARKSLIGFTDYTNPSYAAAEHHRAIAERLEAVERGESDRVMLFTPPRHGKSELASRRFPAWYLGRNPLEQIIAASYNSDLASDFGRDVRNIVASPEYQALFGVALAADSQAANRWHTEDGGQYVAAGVGTAVTGRGAKILLIDDPIKDREEADSETRREQVYNWYRSTAYTRLMPGGAIILIQTRWHEDDLAGRLLQEAERGGDQWEVLRLPALNDDGEALWPEWYDERSLARIRKTVGPREWSSLYQQEPMPEGGLYFKREWARWYDTPPNHLRVYGASDYAVTSGGGDYTVHGVVGVDPNDDIYILDWWRRQTDSDIWIDAFLDMVAVHQPLKWAEEAGQINKSLGPIIDRRMRERKTYCARQQYPSVRNKPTRARSFQARMAMGKVYFPKNAPWIDALMSELLSFDAGKNDDQVDVLSLIGRMVNEMVGASEPPRAGKPRDRWPIPDTEPVDSWKTV